MSKKSPHPELLRKDSRLETLPVTPRKNEKANGKRYNLRYTSRTSRRATTRTPSADAMNANGRASSARSKTAFMTLAPAVTTVRPPSRPSHRATKWRSSIEQPTTTTRPPEKKRIGIEGNEGAPSVLHELDCIPGPELGRSWQSSLRRWPQSVSTAAGFASTPTTPAPLILEDAIARVTGAGTRASTNTEAGTAANKPSCGGDEEDDKGQNSIAGTTAGRKEGKRRNVNVV